MSYFTAEQKYGSPPMMYPDARPAMWVPLRFWHRRDIYPFVPGEDIDAVPALVVVNHERWCASCPSCGGAQIPSMTDHWYFCGDCLNSEDDYKLIPLVWPSDPSPHGIMSELSLRRVVSQCNWLPGDTLDFLRTETIKSHPEVTAETLPNRLAGRWTAPVGPTHHDDDIQRFMKIARIPKHVKAMDTHKIRYR